MATTARKATKTATTATDKLNLSPRRAAVKAASFGADAKGVPGKSAKVLAVKTVSPTGRMVAHKVLNPAKKPATRVGQLAKDKAREINDGATYDNKTTPLKEQRKMDAATKKARAALDAGKAPAAFEKAVKAGLKAARKPKADKDAKALDKIVKRATVVKAAKKAATVTFRGFVIPVGRKSSDSEDGVPTITVKNVSETIKLFEKLPKGCSWLTDTSAATKDTLNLYNKAGAYIAEVRIAK